MIYTVNNVGGAPIDFEAREFYARTLQNVKNLLCCRRGEVPYDRKMGLDTALEHMSYGDIKEVILAEVERTLGWEPDAKVVAVRVTPVEDGEIYIEADIAIEEG